MSSKRAIKWLARLREPRSIESLISEIYGEAAWYGCLFEREVADLLNFADLSHNPLEAMTRDLFNTEDWTLNQLLQELAKRDLPAEHLTMLRDGKDARNELVHRLIATRCVISTADKELFLAEIDALYFRVWRAYRFVRDLKKQCAAKIGVTDERVNEIVRRKREEAQMEDDNLKNLLGEDPDRPGA
jgi:hypothetical protein